MINFRSFQVLSVFPACFAIMSATVAMAGIGMPYGEYSMAYQGPGTLTLFVIPDGGGDSFDQASLPSNVREDATITLFLMDATDLPIPFFPREDMWLESQDGGLVICLGGSTADANTDALGMTLWRNPMHAGGYSETLTHVIVNGSNLEPGYGLPLNYNSPDINGDLVVNLSDVQLFADDFSDGVYHFRSDFHRDGMVNLSDLPPLASSLGAACP